MTKLISLGIVSFFNCLCSVKFNMSLTVSRLAWAVPLPYITLSTCAKLISSMFLFFIVSNMWKTTLAYMLLVIDNFKHLLPSNSLRTMAAGQPLPIPIIGTAGRGSSKDSNIFIISSR